MHIHLNFKIQKSNADSKLSDFSSESNSDEHTNINMQTSNHIITFETKEKRKRIFIR